MKRLFAGLIAVCLILAATGCGAKPANPGEELPEEGQSAAEDVPAGPKSPVEGKKVALIPRGTDDTLWAAASEGARRYAAQWGLELLVMDSALPQPDAVRQAVEQGVSGICISISDAEAVSEALREARSAGVCVTTWGTDALTDDRTLMVSQGTASVMGAMLVEMGVASLRERERDPAGEILYLWHGAGEDDPEQAAWYDAAKGYIRQNYPEWTELDAPYVSGEDAAQTGRTLLDDYGADVALILCGSPRSLLGQCAAAQERGLTAQDVTITGFCAPSEMKAYLDAGVCARWGLWDVGMQSAMGCYLAAWLGDGNDVHVGDVANIPRIGSVEILANSEIVEDAQTGPVNNGVVLLPERIIFTAENAGDYHF